jgi:ribosomal-protein-alanine N-acetyltransferase
VIATPAHAAAMAAIHAAAFPDEPWDEASFLVLLGQPGVFGFIDERGGVLLLRLVADEAEILTIGVTVRRQGIATRLMGDAMAKAAEAGAGVMHLEAAAGNAPARGLYDSLGFTQTGRRAKYYVNGDDAVLLSRRLESQ